MGKGIAGLRTVALKYFNKSLLVRKRHFKRVEGWMVFSTAGKSTLSVTAAAAPVVIRVSLAKSRSFTRGLRLVFRESDSQSKQDTLQMQVDALRPLHVQTMEPNRCLTASTLVHE